jgi:hypothetical protein
MLKKIPCPLRQLDRHHVPMLVALRRAHSNPSGLRPAAARLLTLIGWLATGYPPRKDLNSPEEGGFTLSAHGSRVRSGGELRIRPFQDLAAAPRRSRFPFVRGLAAPKEVIITARKRIREPSTAAFRISMPSSRRSLANSTIGGSLNGMTVAVRICCPSGEFYRQARHSPCQAIGQQIA